MKLSDRNRRLSKDGKGGHSLNLADTVRLWRTPDANMERGKRSYENMKMRIDRCKPLNLNDQLNAVGMGLLPPPQTWPTPKANAGAGFCVHGQGGYDLQTAVHLLPTPRAGNPGSRPNGKGGKVLAEEVKKRVLFPTPTLPRPHDSEHTIGKYYPRSRQDLASAVAQNGGQLSPEWVEKLMGYPLGWTDIEKDCSMKNEFPAAWLDGTWEDGVPRVTASGKNRAKRLKCLGNAVVPQIPMMIWLAVKYHLAGIGKVIPAAGNE